MTDAGLKKIEILEAEDENCRLALSRLTAYRPDKDPTCPHCWIVNEVSSPVLQTGRREVYRCGTCKAEYTVSAGPQP